MDIQSALLYLTALLVILLAWYCSTESEMAPGETKMRAVVRQGADMIFKDNYATPAFGEREVLIRVQAGAINPVDYKLRWPIVGPVVGNDFAGIIEQVGSKVGNFEVGDEVYGTTGKGSLAEMTVAKQETIAKKPTSLSFVESAAMPVAYLTSLQGIRHDNNITNYQ